MVTFFSGGKRNSDNSENSENSDNSGNSDHSDKGIFDKDENDKDKVKGKRSSSKKQSVDKIEKPPKSSSGITDHGKVSKKNDNRRKKNEKDEQMAAVKELDKQNDKIYKSIYEINNNCSDTSFLNYNSIPWVSSFFSLKDEDFAIFGNELKKRNIFKRCFQRIHKNRRRRCMSFNPYRVPLVCKKIILEEMLISEPNINKKKKKNNSSNKKNKKKKKKKKSGMMPYGYFYKNFIMRGKKKNWLETHMYHSKRFRMINMYGYKLALKNCSKISRRIFRYSKRKSLIHDLSYVEIIQLSAHENIIIDILKKCTNVLQANMLRKKYLLGLLLGKIFIHRYDPDEFAIGGGASRGSSMDITGTTANMTASSNANASGTYAKTADSTDAIKRTDASNQNACTVNSISNPNSFDGSNFFSANNSLICPAYFLWRSKLKSYKYFKKISNNKMKEKNSDSIVTISNVSEAMRNHLNYNCHSFQKEEHGTEEETKRDLWVFVHPTCLKKVIENFQKINNSQVIIKHIKNICMYELMGPKSFQLLVNILKVKNKYYMETQKDHVYNYSYEDITLPYDFVIPLYAILPKSIGPFLLNYKVNDSKEQKWGNEEIKSVNNNNKCSNSGNNYDQVRENKLFNDKKKYDNFIENSFDYLKEKNGNAVLNMNKFSPYDNNILMNEKIKQNVIKHIKVNKYEHVRSSKKKKVKTCIMKMLKNNKNIESYDVIKQRRESDMLFINMGEECSLDKSAVTKVVGASAETNVENKYVLRKMKGDSNSFQGGQTTEMDNLSKKHVCLSKEKEKEKEEKEKKKGFESFRNEKLLQNYVHEFLENYDKKKCKKEGILERNEMYDMYRELKETKEKISHNMKSYIKIPILIINQTNGNNKRYFILCPSKKKSTVLFHLLVRNGSIAIGLKEREKILKCSEFLCYPKDFPDSYGGILYNNFREELSKKNYFKKPIGKRINYYCLGINNPFNYSWFCIYPYNENIKIIRCTDPYNQFLIKTFLHRFLTISFKRIYSLDTFETFDSFMEEFKTKFFVFSSFYISVYVHAHKGGTPKRMAHVCSLTLKRLIKLFMKQVGTNKLHEWVMHKRIRHTNKKKEKIKKFKESVIHKYKNRIMKKSKSAKGDVKVQTNGQIKGDINSKTCEKKDIDEIILPSKKIIGYVSSGGHVLSKGYGYGVAHISFYLLLQNLLHHIFALKLMASDPLKINNRAKEFPSLALIRNIDSVHYYPVWLSLVTEDKYLPF
ncbi:ribonucleases P/MRP protein subunit POP1, putative [Plasmodium malariae]|uniref:Ribonucleases P/MRP protein subunit POP1, putative n=1 Tax=Plasmodium malariae TaxID=5858 RepID=A0A1D3JK98_PLAMA|nr:ribonucleases P/MRP protein subunit POP1, putative [Plasmodium malariae]SBT86919.1 ribonucleases P/MRP protein subunit POP1, putative [Plasmodium malariae]